MNKIGDPIRFVIKIAKRIRFERKHLKNIQFLFQSVLFRNILNKSLFNYKHINILVFNQVE